MKKYVLLVILLCHWSIFAQQIDSCGGGLLLSPTIPEDVVLYGGIHDFNDPIYLFPCGRIFKKQAITIVAEKTILDSLPHTRKGWVHLLLSKDCYFFRLYDLDYLNWLMKRKFQIDIPDIPIKKLGDIFGQDTLHHLSSANYRMIACKRFYVLYMSLNTFNVRMNLVIDTDSSPCYYYTAKNQKIIEKGSLQDSLFIKILVPIIE